jgi:hypothetical protein
MSDENAETQLALGIVEGQHPPTNSRPEEVTGQNIATQRLSSSAEDPLRRDYDMFCTQRQSRYDALKADIQSNYRARLETAVTGAEKRQASAERDRSLRTAAEDFGPLTFVEWGAANRGQVERHETVREGVADLGRYRQEQKIAPRRSVESPQPRRTYTLSPEAIEAVERHRERAQPDIIDEIRQAMRENGVRDRDLPTHAELEAQLRDLRAKVEKRRPSSYAYEPLSEAQQLAREWQAMQRSQKRGISRGGRGM